MCPGAKDECTVPRKIFLDNISDNHYLVELAVGKTEFATSVANSGTSNLALTSVIRASHFL